MLDSEIVKDLHQKLFAGDAREQAQSALHIRDLCAEKEEYRASFGSVVAPLVGLLDAAPASQSLTHTAAQALAYLAEREQNRDKIRLRAGTLREIGGVETMVSVLKALSKASVSTPQGRDLRTTLLDVLLALAVDEPNRVAASKAGLIPLLVQMLGSKDDSVGSERAAKLVGRLAYNRTIKDSVRDARGINALLALLPMERGRQMDPRLAETVMVALTILAVNNELNQDAIREEFGVAPIVKLLEGQLGPAATSAAADAVRAIALNNDANKTALREAWALPQLVKLLLPEVEDSLVGKAVDSLRILTTGNDPNKVALVGIPSSLASLVRLMDTDKPNVIVERAAAVVGNLSTMEGNFQALREAGVMQRLVRLLEQGPQSRVTEIAAKTLATLAASDSNQTAVRLAGGIPPLMRLLTVRPSEQVLNAVEEALRRLQVSGAERNAILDTLRYFDDLQQRSQRVSQESVAAASTSSADATDGAADRAAPAESSSSKPLTRYTTEETVDLLQSVGFRDVAPIETNGLNGADMLEVTEQELREELGLSHFQVMKVRGLRDSFQVFNSILRRPGSGEITFLELQDWLLRQGRSEADAECIRQGFKSALGASKLAVLSFGDFARTYAWFASTLRMMAGREEARGSGGVPPSMTSSASLSEISPMPTEQAKSNGTVPSAPGEG